MAEDPTICAVRLTVARVIMSSTDSNIDRRRETRFAIGAPAVLRAFEGGDAYSAVTVNVSSGGLLLQSSEPHPFRVGDDVMCEIAIVDAPQHPLASWGVGRVVRVDEGQAAIELKAAIFAD